MVEDSAFFSLSLLSCLALDFRCARRPVASRLVSGIGTTFWNSPRAKKTKQQNRFSKRNEKKGAERRTIWQAFRSHKGAEEWPLQWGIILHRTHRFWWSVCAVFPPVSPSPREPKGFRHWNSEITRWTSMYTYKEWKERKERKERI